MGLQWRQPVAATLGAREDANGPNSTDDIKFDSGEAQEREKTRIAGARRMRTSRSTDAPAAREKTRRMRTSEDK